MFISHDADQHMKTIQEEINSRISNNDLVLVSLVTLTPYVHFT